MNNFYNISILCIKTSKYTRLVYLKSTITMRFHYRSIQKTILYSKDLNSKQHVVLQTVVVAADILLTLMMNDGDVLVHDELDSY